MNRRAIELSINFLVIFILSMAMFATGVVLSKKIFGTAEDIKGELDQKTKEEINRLLADGPYPFVMPVKTFKIKRGETDIVAIGLRNDLYGTDTFYLHAECNMLMDTSKQVVCEEGTVSCASHESNCNKWIVHTSIDESNNIGPISLGRNEKTIEAIFVVVPKSCPLGTYRYNIRACTEQPCASENQYSTVRKLDIIVV